MLSPFCKVDWIRPQSQRAGAQSPRETAAFETSGRPASVCFLDNCLFSFPGKAWTIVFYRIFSSLVLDLDISSQLTCFVWEMHLNKLMKPLLRMNPFRLLTEKFWKGNIITDKKKKKTLQPLNNLISRTLSREAEHTDRVLPTAKPLKVAYWKDSWSKICFQITRLENIPGRKYYYTMSKENGRLKWLEDTVLTEIHSTFPAVCLPCSLSGSMDWVGQRN